MKLKYFKTNIWGDCYVPENDFYNVITISKSDTCLMAFDDSNLEGVYKPLKVSKKDYNSLREVAANQNRKQVIGLLRKIHKNNEGILNSEILKVQEITDPLFNGYYDAHHKAFENKKPILK